MASDRYCVTIGDVDLEYFDNTEASAAAEIIAMGLPEGVGIRFDTYYSDGDHWGVTISRLMTQIIFEPDPLTDFGVETAGAWRSNPHTQPIGRDM